VLFVVLVAVGVAVSEGTKEVIVLAGGVSVIVSVLVIVLVLV